jgi:hypothetical protein
MKKISLLFLFFIQFFSAFSQMSEDSQLVTVQHIRLTNGTIYYVKKPVLICDSTVIFILKTSNNIRSERIQSVESISRNSSPRWITKSKFETIGTSPVFGYVASIFVSFPPGMRFVILGDVIKRERIKKMYKSVKNVI